MRNYHDQPDAIKENIIDSVVLNLQYNESVRTERQTLDTAESHFYDYMFPTIRDTIESYQPRQIVAEKIEIDLGSIELRDIPQKLEMMLKEALEKHISEDEERTRAEQEIAVIKEDSSHHMIDFLCQEQLPWTEEPELFEPKTWWNENLQKLLSTPSDLHTLYKHCQSGAASLYRLLTYSNRSGLTRLLTKWIIDDDIVPSQLKEILNKAGLTTEHAISLKVKELTKPQIELLLIAILSVKENCASISLENATNVLTGFTQKTFDYELKFSEEDLIKELLKQAYLEVEYNTSHSDNTFPAETDIRKTLTQHDYSGKEDVMEDNNEGRTTHHHDKDTPEHNRDTEGNSSEVPKEGIKTDNQIQMLLNALFPDMHPNSASNDYDAEGNNRYSTDVAGIVLLHPFLANYFRQVRLLDENDQFISLKKQIHAVHLLRYLTGKKGRHHSHLLNAEKIICGLPPTFPIPTKHSISEMEKKETQDMFDAVKQYWKSISKTSIEGILTSFIHRHGIITFEEPYWLIRVEGSTLDILMDDLPWEMSMLIFPWMNRNILIEWQNAI